VAESPVVGFYRGTGTDHAGRRLDDILAWDDDALEAVHDYIQWTFPNADPSRANPFAPRLTADDERIFRSEPVLRSRLRQSFVRMLAFYGLELVETGDGRVDVRRAAAWPVRAGNWLEPYNHNHLRLTRIMKCLNRLGLEPEALALQRTLLDLAERTHTRSFSRGTVRYWRTALD
jgi:hypothetical protein